MHVLVEKLDLTSTLDFSGQVLLENRALVTGSVLPRQFDRRVRHVPS
jgi:hypothetical protein